MDFKDRELEEKAIRSKTWGGSLPWLLMSLPLLGFLFALGVYSLQPRQHPAYRDLEGRLGYWSERSRAVFTQLYIVHAIQAGLDPSGEVECALALQQGDDFTACEPKVSGRAQESAKLMNDLAEFVIQNTHPHGVPALRNPAAIPPAGGSPPRKALRQWDPEAI